MSVFAFAGARSHLSRAPIITIGLAALVTAAVLLPPIYLVIRASSAGSEIFDILTESAVAKALVRTLWLTFTVTAATIVLAVPLAWLTLRTDLPFRGVWSTLLALPLAVPTFVGGFIMISALGPGGLLQDLLEPFGVERLPSIYGFKGSWFILTILSYPYVYLSVRSALLRLDPAFEEAARSLGRSQRDVFLHVTMPLLRPAIAAGAILVALYVLSEFGAVAMLRYDTLTPLVYIQYTSRFDRSFAAVLGMPLIALAVLFVALDSMTRGAGRYHSRGQVRPAKIHRLGWWKVPATLLCLFVVTMGIGIPVSVVVYWLVRGISQGEGTHLLGAAVFNSAQASGLAALCAVLAAIPIAILSARRPGWVANIFEKATYSGQSLPGITIALSLVFFTANYMPRFYQTLALLVFAYVVRFLPQAFGACRSAMLQVNPNTEEAARGLGASPLRVFTRVTVPQILPGMSTGALLVFLTAMKELPITLLLSPIGYDTLATQIWSATSEAFFTKAALPSLMLVGLSGVAVFLMLRREKMES